MDKQKQLEQVKLISQRAEQGAEQSSNAIETLLQFIDLLILEIEDEVYKHGLTTEQCHRFAGRLGRINRMLDEAGVALEGNADERLAKMLNREMPNYPT